MGCSQGKSGGAGLTLKDALEGLARDYTKDEAGKEDKVKAKDVLDELNRRFKPDSEEECTAKKERMELREFCLDVAWRMSWGEKGTGVVDGLYPDNAGEIEMKTTKIADFDSLFGKAADPLNTCIKLRDNMSEAKQALLDACSFGKEVKGIRKVKDAFKMLKEELKGVKPKITFNEKGLDVSTEGMEGPVAAAFENMKKYVACLMTTLTSMPPLADQIKTLGTEAAALPPKARTAATDAKLGFSDTLNAVKFTMANVKALGDLPAIITQTVEAAKSNIDALKEGATSLSS